MEQEMEELLRSIVVAVHVLALRLTEVDVEHQRPVGGPRGFGQELDPGGVVAGRGGERAGGLDLLGGGEVHARELDALRWILDPVCRQVDVVKRVEEPLVLVLMSAAPQKKLSDA